MELASVILRQTVIMALYMLAGFVMFKSGKITREGSRSIANLLIWLILPLVIVRGFSVDFTPQRLKQLGSSALLSVLALALALPVSRIIYRRAPIDDFGAAFSNCGFIGIPLVRAALGEEAVFFTISFVALLNIAQFTYGVGLLNREAGRVTLRKVFLNPFIISTLLGLILFLTGLGARMPSVLSGMVEGVTALNSPMAMIVLGVYLAQTDLKKLFVTPRLYGVSAVRLLLIPMLTIGLFLPFGADPAVRYAVLFCAAAPVGSNAAVYAQLYDADYPYACQLVALSSLLGILTLPALAMIAGLLPGF